MIHSIRKSVVFVLFGVFLGAANALAVDTIADGNWNDPNTWDGTEVPAKGTFARVMHDVTVAAYTERGQPTTIDSNASLTINSGITFFQEFNLVRVNNAAVVTVNGTLTAREFLFNQFNGQLHLAGPSFEVTTTRLEYSGGNNTVRLDNSGGNVTSFQVPEISDSFTGNNKNKWVWDADTGNPVVPADVTGDITKADQWELTVNFNGYDPEGPVTLVTYGGSLNDTGGFGLTVTGSSDSWSVDTSVSGEIRIVAIPSVIETIADGDWDAPSTWEGGFIPTATTTAAIYHDVAVTAAVTRGQPTTIQTGGNLSIQPGVTFFQEFNLVRLRFEGILNVAGSFEARELGFDQFGGLINLTGGDLTVNNEPLYFNGGNNTVRVDNSSGDVQSFQVPGISDSFTGNNKNKWIWDADTGNPVIPVDVTGDITKADQWDFTVNLNDYTPADPTVLMTHGGSLNDTGGFNLAVTGSSDAWVVDTSEPGEIRMVVAAAAAVPDVLGKTESEATDALTGAGFTVNSVRQPQDLFPVDEVFSQDPDGGTMAAAGTEVIIYVSNGLPTGLDWTGATDNQFDIGGNWVGVGDVEPEGEWPPDISERLRINNGDTVSYNGDSIASITARRLVVSNDSLLNITGGLLTLDTTLSVGSPGENPGTVVMTGGTLDVTEGFAVRIGETNADAVATGEGVFIVGGDAIVLANNVLMPQTGTVFETVIGGTARLEIHGSGVTFDVLRDFTMSPAGTSSLAFVADADGFSTIEVSTNVFNVRHLVLNGTLEIDFDGHQAALESGVTTERVFTLISHKGSITDESGVLAATGAALPENWSIANDPSENAVKLTFTAPASVGDWVHFN